MNKHGFIICGIVAMFLLAGCSMYYQPIAKDSVMVRKITQVTTEEKKENPGALSEDTVRTLSVNAINTFFDTQFSLEDVDIEVERLELKQIKNMLYSLRRTSDADPLVQYNAEISEIPNGLYSVIMTNQYDLHIYYSVMLNAMDGDILRVQKYGENRSSFDRGKSFNPDEIIAVAKQFLERQEDIHPEELELGEQTVFQQATYDAILFFQNKKTKSTQYVVSLDLSTKEILGYSKDIMTVLSYSYLAGPS